MWSFTAKRREFHDAHTAAMNRISALEAPVSPCRRRTRRSRAEWDKWVADGNASRKAISDAQRNLSDARGMAELSLSRPNGATVDATQYDGEMITKEVLLTPSVKPPDGPVRDKKLKATSCSARRSRTRPARTSSAAGSSRPSVRREADRGHAGGSAGHLARLGQRAPGAAVSAPLTRVAPSGPVAWPFEFRWKGARPGRRRAHPRDGRGRTSARRPRGPRRPSGRARGLKSHAARRRCATSGASRGWTRTARKSDASALTVHDSELKLTVERPLTAP